MRLYDDAVTSFKSDLFHDALKATSPTVVRVRALLVESRKVLGVSPSAAYLFAATAVEISLRKLFIEPIISGLIHNAAAVPWITDAILKQNAFDRISPVLNCLPQVAPGIDLAQSRRKGAAEPLLREVRIIGKKRNDIIHRGDIISGEDAEHALAVATDLLGEIFAALLGTFSLRMMREGEQQGLWPRDAVVVVNNH